MDEKWKAPGATEREPWVKEACDMSFMDEFDRSYLNAGSFTDENGEEQFWGD